MSRLGHIRLNRFTGATIVLAASSLIVVVVAASVVGAPLTGLISCGNGNVTAPVFAELDVPDGASIFKHLPNLGKTPEISDPSGPLHNGPLHVTIFKGQVCGLPALMPPLQSGAPAPVFKDVVRVTRADGDAWYFSGVDLTTFVP
jgi:hypothetical protein